VRTGEIKRPNQQRPSSKGLAETRVNWGGRGTWLSWDEGTNPENDVKEGVLPHSFLGLGGKIFPGGVSGNPDLGVIYGENGLMRPTLDKGGTSKGKTTKSW